MNANFLIYTILPGAGGFLLSWLFPGISLKWLLIPCLIVVLFPNFIVLDVSFFKDLLSQLKPMSIILVVGFVVSPLVAWAIGTFFLKASPAFVIIGFTLFALVPGNALALVFVKMRQGDASLSIVAYAICFLLATGFVPAWSHLLLEKIVPIPTGVIIRSFIIIIVTPMVLAMIARYLFLRNASQEGSRRFRVVVDKAASLSFAAIFFSIFVERGRLLVDHPEIITKVLPSAALLLTACLVCGLMLSKIFKLSRSISEAVILAGTAKNTIIALALATTAFGNSEAMIVAVCGPITQLPFMLLYVSVANLIFRR